MYELQEKPINTISCKLDLKSCISDPVTKHVTTLRLPDHYKYTLKVFSRFQISHPLEHYREATTKAYMPISRFQEFQLLNIHGSYLLTI